MLAEREVSLSLGPIGALQSCRVLSRQHSAVEHYGDRGRKA